jgi:protoporphyrinogen oxidase
MGDSYRPVTILGAGLTGLTAGYILSRQGVAVQLFERESQAGGMAVTLQKGDFRFDLGPHRFYTQDQEVIGLIKELLGNELLEHKRMSRIHLRGHYLEYPPNVANLVRSTAPITSLGYLWGYLQANWGRGNHTNDETDFENWVVSRFGRPLYELYFEPYTQKVWGRPPRELSAELARRRISVPNLGDVLLRLMISSNKNPGPYVTRFWYPEKGIGRIAERLVEEIIAHGGEVNLGHSVEALHLEANRVVGLTIKNVGTSYYKPTDRVFSTIPLPYLIQAIDPVQEVFVQRACELPYRALLFVFLVLDKPRVGNDHWIYFPEKRFTFNRVSEPRTFSPGHAPSGMTSLCVEITCDVGDEIWNLSTEKLTERVVSQLDTCGLIDPGEVSGSFTHRLRYGYPIYTVGYKKCLDSLLAYIGTIENLVTCGRQGTFDYSNMSEAIANSIKNTKIKGTRWPNIVMESSERITT